MGLEHTIFCSRKKAEARPGWSDWAVISISEPEPSNTLLYGPAQLQTGWGQILRLEFHDIDEPEEPYILFTEKQAREIIQFVRECDEPDSGITGILVHCRAGISRSAAISMWIAEKYELPFAHGYSLYNKRVYQILREEALLIGFEKSVLT